MSESSLGTLCIRTEIRILPHSKETVETSYGQNSIAYETNRHSALVQKPQISRPLYVGLYVPPSMIA